MESRYSVVDVVYTNNYNAAHLTARHASDSNCRCVISRWASERFPSVTRKTMCYGDSILLVIEFKIAPVEWSVSRRGHLTRQAVYVWKFPLAPEFKVISPYGAECLLSTPADVIHAACLRFVYRSEQPQVADCCDDENFFTIPTPATRGARNSGRTLSMWSGFQNRHGQDRQDLNWILRIGHELSLT